MENISGWCFRNNKRMTLNPRHNIHEGKTVIVFIDFFSRNFTAQNFLVSITSVQTISGRQPVLQLAGLCKVRFANRSVLLVLSDGDGCGSLGMQLVDPAKGDIRGEVMVPQIHSARTPTEMAYGMAKRSRRTARGTTASTPRRSTVNRARRSLVATIRTNGASGAAGSEWTGRRVSAIDSPSRQTSSILRLLNFSRYARPLTRASFAENQR